MDDNPRQGRMSVGSIGSLFGTRKTRLRPPSVIVTADEDENIGDLNVVAGFGRIGRKNGNIPGIGQEGVNNEATTSGVGTETMQASDLRVLPRKQEGMMILDNSGAPSGRKKHGPFRRVLTFFSRLFVGLAVTACVAAAWVGATHAIKFAYRRDEIPWPPWDQTPLNASEPPPLAEVYGAPFLTTWCCTLWTALFLPLFLLIQIVLIRDVATVRSLFKEATQQLKGRVVTPFKFSLRIMFFCVLWVGTNYLYMLSLRVLDATDVMALYATSVGFVYLLSWVVLHDQFVGVRIVAVILCNTGIALLAYMDGVSRTPTLGGVVLGAAASAGSAVYKVIFRKLMGEASLTTVAMFFSLISLVNSLLLWPLPLGLYLTGVEKFSFSDLPWLPLLIAGGLSLVANILGNLGILLTYDIFITMGLVVAVPLSAVLDHVWYDVEFAGMKLAGIVLIVSGFLLVLLPENWTDYFALLLSLGRTKKTHHQSRRHSPDILSSGHFHISRLRTPSGKVK